MADTDNQKDKQPGWKEATDALAMAGVHPEKIRTRMKEAHDDYKRAVEDDELEKAGYLVAREVAGLSLAVMFLARQVQLVGEMIDPQTGSVDVVSAIGDLGQSIQEVAATISQTSEDRIVAIKAIGDPKAKAVAE